MMVEHPANIRSMETESVVGLHLASSPLRNEKKQPKFTLKFLKLTSQASMSSLKMSFGRVCLILSNKYWDYFVF